MWTFIKSKAMEFSHTKLRLFSLLNKGHWYWEKKKSWNKSRNSNNSFLMHPVKKKKKVSFYCGINESCSTELHQYSLNPVYSNLQDGWYIWLLTSVNQESQSSLMSWNIIGMQYNLAHSFSPLKTTALSHGQLQQQEARVLFNSSFGIKEVWCDSSFIHCM